MCLRSLSSLKLEDEDSDSAALSRPDARALTRRRAAPRSMMIASQPVYRTLLPTETQIDSNRMWCNEGGEREGKAGGKLAGTSSPFILTCFPSRRGLEFDAVIPRRATK